MKVEKEDDQKASQQYGRKQVLRGGAVAVSEVTVISNIHTDGRADEQSNM